MAVVVGALVLGVVAGCRGTSSPDPAAGPSVGLSASGPPSPGGQLSSGGPLTLGDQHMAAAAALFASRARAVASGDPAEWMGSLADPLSTFAADQRAAFETLRALAVADFAYLSVWSPAPGEVAARGRYRLPGHDPAGSEFEERHVLGAGGRLAARVGPPDLPWELEGAQVARDGAALVLGNAAAPVLEKAARDADQASAFVRAGWAPTWSGAVVVLAPKDSQDLARLCRCPPVDFDGVAAATVGPDRPGLPAPADRVLLNPQVWRRLTEQGQQVVLTHEAVHLALRSTPRPARPPPLWAVEGLAELVANSAAGVSPRTAVAALLPPGPPPPSAPPGDRAFSGRGTSLAQAYAGAHVGAMEVLARGGRAGLLRFATGRASLTEATGLPPQDFARAWRARVQALRAGG